MKVLDFTIPQYNWKIRVYYHKTQYFTDRIIEDLKSIGCKQDCLKDARANLEKDTLNSGLCYSNQLLHKTIIVIARTSCPLLFMNSWAHESKHLLSHMELELDIDPYSEEAAYLCGYIAQRTFDVAKTFLCKCYSEESEQSC